MREREYFEQKASNASELKLLDMILEIMLDCRDLLNQRPFIVDPAKFPISEHDDIPGKLTYVKSKGKK